MQKLIRRAIELDPAYRPADFSSYYYVEAPPKTDLIALELALGNWSNVELVYIAQVGPDPAVNASDDLRIKQLQVGGIATESETASINAFLNPQRQQGT